MSLKLPVKIGNDAGVSAYAATLVAGEEQLLITREGKLNVTKGDGTFITISTGLTEAQISALIDNDTNVTTLQSDLAEALVRISDLEAAITNLGGFA